MTTADDVWLGGCLCGQVRYRAQGTPQNRTNCHCETCRRASGAPFVSWATFPRAGFEFTQGQPSRYVSSDIASRGFCSNCGTQLTFHLNATPEAVDVTLASLDRPDSIVPVDHIWTRRQLRWIRLDDGLPRHEENRPES